MKIENMEFKYVDDIAEEKLREFTQKVLGDIMVGHALTEEQRYKLLNGAEQSICVMFRLLERKKVFKRSKKPYANYMSILISATYLYYASRAYDVNMNDNYVNLFRIRKDYSKMAADLKLDFQEFDYLCQAIEGAMGDDGIPRCKPIADSPAEWMALAIYIAENRWILFKDELDEQTD